MYSEKIIEQAIKDFRDREGWEPVRHTLSEVQEFKAYIASITQQQTNTRNSYIAVIKRLTEKRQKQIRRFIENEQVMCSLDSGYFETRYAYICDEKGEIFKFKNRQAQEVFDQVIAGFEAGLVSIEILLLKARQLGMSTKTALKFIHRLLFRGHTQAVMASVQAEKSELIARILNICYENCPWWLIPRRTTERVGKMMGFDNGSILSIQSGMQPTGIAQGWTPTNIHISEIGDIPNPQKVIEEGLLKATHSSRNLFLVFEGTGNGNTGWLADKWRASKEGWPRGASRLFPMFISWPLASDIYPEPDWLVKFPVPEGWQPAKETRKHVQRCQMYIRNTDYLSRVCGPNWTMPRHQQWFWEFNYLEACKSHTQKIWLSQMPADDYEALTGKNDSIFEPDVIELCSEVRKREFTAYAITGDSIDDGFEPDESQIDYNLPRIIITWESHRGQKFEWTMIPLLPFDETQERLALDKLIVWHEPEQGRNYSIGIDTADGLNKEDEDRSVLCVTRNGKGENQDEQVAELCSQRINPPQMVGFAACVAAWYGLHCADPRGVKFCIEQRERPGDDCQLQLKLMGFNFHHIMMRYDGKNIKEGDGQLQGWYASNWSVPFLMNRFVDAVNNQWYKPNSPWLIKELENLERKIVAGKTKIEHQTGKKDDRVRASAHSYITRHHLDVLAERSQKRYAPAIQALPPIDNSPSGGGMMSIGD